MKYLSFIIFLAFFALSCTTMETKTSNTDAANMKLLKANTKSKDAAYLSGEKAIVAGDYKSAYKFFGESKIEDAVFYKALSAMNLGESTEAISLFMKSAESSVKQAESYFNLGLIYYSMDDKETSFNFMSKALKLEPFHQGANYFMGSVKYKDGIYIQAEKFYKNVLKSDPKSPDAVSALFYTLVNENKNEEAWNLKDVVSLNDTELILNLLNIGNALAHNVDVVSIIDKNKFDGKEFMKEKLKALFAMEKFDNAKEILDKKYFTAEKRSIPLYVKKLSEITFMIYLDAGALKAGVKENSEFKEVDIELTDHSIKELSSGKEFFTIDQLVTAMLKM